MHKCVNNSIGNVYHLEQFVNDFFPYSQKQLGFDKPVTIRFESDDDNASRMLGKTAYYDPTNMEVALYVDGRHPKDVMRSLSHELVHHAQNCRGDFTDDTETYEGYAQADPHLRKMEREAYTKGNLIFRDYEDLIKTGKKDVDIDFTKSGEPKMSLKEWKNNELHSKLLKKWGLLKEDSGAEERRHAEDNIRDDKKHIKNLKRDVKDDESELEEGWGWRDEDDEKRLEEFGSGTGFRDDDADKESEKDPADYTGTRGKEDKAVSALKRGGAVEEAASRKISVREAKEITRRIIERIRKEGK